MGCSIRATMCATCILYLAAGCATQASGPANELSEPANVAVLNRVTWGVNYSTVQQAADMGIERYLERQLSPGPGQLPPAAQAQIAAMTISQRPLEQLVFELEQRRKDADAIANGDEKKVAQKAYQQELNRLGREAATRALLCAIYSPNQLQEQMTWFWMNHFSVHEGKQNLRAMVGDYEERAIRPHALGKFRDLLAATLHHPAILRYLDNDQNALNHVNENYARELMELHTLGVDGGYTQRDVQELARMLTGVGVNLRPVQEPARMSTGVGVNLRPVPEPARMFTGVGVNLRPVPEPARMSTGVGVNLRPGMPNVRRELQAHFAAASSCRTDRGQENADRIEAAAMVA